MPLNRLLFIIACVIAAAAATVYLGVSLAERTQLSSFTGLAVLGLIALFASFGWRVYTDHRKAKDDPPRDN